MAIYQNQKGFWAKRAMDSVPQFIAVGGTDVPDALVEQTKKEWATRTGYTGNQATNNVEWVDSNTYSNANEATKKFYTDIASGNVAAYSPATPDPVEENYFDTALKLVEEESAGQKNVAQQSYDTLVNQLKESRDLFNTNLESEYGKALEQANIGVYSRGVGDSGIKNEEMSGVTGEKEYKTAQEDLLEKQKKEIASQDLQNKMDAIARQETQSKFSISNSKASASPYAKYSYT